VRSRRDVVLDDEIKWWREQVDAADTEDKRDLAFIMWGIATGMMMAREIMRGKR